MFLFSATRELKRDRIMDYAGYYVHLITVALKSLTWWCLTMGGNILSAILLRNPLSLCIFSTEVVTVEVRMRIVQSENGLYKKGSRLVYPWPGGYL